MSADQLALAIQILSAVAFLFACFLAYMSVKSWRWFHIVMVFFVFLAVFPYLVLAAYVGKARTAWMKVEDGLAKRVEKENLRADELKSGDRSKLSEIPKGDYHRHKDIPANVFDPNWVKETSGGNYPIDRLTHVLHRTALDRGRVWRGCRRTDAKNDGGFVEATVTTAAEGAAAIPNHLKAQDVVYAFAENQSAAIPGRIVPIAYIGEFTVVSATDTTATLRSTFPLDASAIAASGRGETMVLYEKMPVDDRDLSPELAKNFTLDGFENNQALLDEATALYNRDGSDAQETDEANNRFQRVKFLKDFELTVNADAAASPLDQPDFDLQGRALKPTLRRQGEDAAKFKGGEEAEFLVGSRVGPAESDTVEKLIADGIVQPNGSVVFRRPLHDYQTEFVLMRFRSQRIKEADALLDVEMAAVTKELEFSKVNIAYRTDEKAKLVADKEKVVYEQSQITTYANKLAKEQADREAEFAAILAQIAAIRDEIASIQARIKAEVDARSGVAASP